MPIDVLSEESTGLESGSSEREDHLAKTDDWARRELAKGRMRMAQRLDIDDDTAESDYDDDDDDSSADANLRVTAKVEAADLEAAPEVEIRPPEEILAEYEAAGLSRKEALIRYLGLADGGVIGTTTKLATGDDTYLKGGLGRKHKTWDDAGDEFEGRKEAGYGLEALGKTSQKYRKMVVRSVGSMDEYGLQMGEALQLLKAAEASLTAQIDATVLPEVEEDLAEGGSGRTGDALLLIGRQARVEGYIKGMEPDKEWVDARADEHHALSKDFIAWEERVHEIIGLKHLYEGPMARPMPEEATEAHAKEREAQIEQVLNARTEARRRKNSADVGTTWCREMKIFDVTVLGKLKTAVSTATKETSTDWLAKKMTAGLVGTTVSEEEVGKKRRSFNFRALADEYRRVKVSCTAIEEAEAYGRGTKAYTSLKMLAEFGIPTLRKVAKAVMAWCALLALFSLGATAPVAAGAASIVVLLTAVKAAIELVLLAWSLLQSTVHTDKDTRALRHTQAERTRHGVGLVEDTATVVSLGMVGMSGGKQMGAGATARSHVKDFAKRDVDYGKVEGTSTGYRTGWATRQAMSSTAAGGAATGALWGKEYVDGSPGLRERNRQDARAKQEVLERRLGKAGGGLGHVGATMDSAVKKADGAPAELREDAKTVKKVGKDVASTAVV